MDLPSFNNGYAKNKGESANPGLWDGLVGAWVPMLGPQGNQVIDISNYGSNGTLTGMNPAADWIPKDQGYGLNVLGGVEFVTMGQTASTAITGNMTIIARISMHAAGFYPMLGGRADQFSITPTPYALYLNSSAKTVSFTYQSFIAVSSLVVPIDGTPVIVAATHDGVKTKLYLDTQVEAITGTSTLTYTAEPFRFGSWDGIATGSGGNSQDLDVSYVLLYDRAVNDTEIASLVADPFSFLKVDNDSNIGDGEISKHIKMGESTMIAFAQESITVSNTAIGFTAATIDANDNNLIDSAIFVVEDAPIRYRLDGNDPTATTGVLGNVGTYIEITGEHDIKNFKAIRVNAKDAVIQPQYLSK